MTPRSIATLFILAVALSACTAQDQPEPAPVMTAQGFYIDDPQPGIVGQFGDLKLRIEAPVKIDKLKISERSYAVDLAKTPERRHLPLFGLERRVEAQSDVTLNFRKYINKKLSSEGTYQFTIEVTDKAGQTTRGDITVELHPDTEQGHAAPVPVETGEFVMERVDRRVIAGTQKFGLEWITTDEVNVTIQLRKAPNHDGALRALTSQGYQSIETKGDIQQLMAEKTPREFIVFDTANNAAAGQHLAVEENGVYYCLSISSSQTSLSELGTTVTLAGQYKY